MENLSSSTSPSPSAGGQPQSTGAVQIQELLMKQQQLQAQYNQIVAWLQANPGQPPEKIQQIKMQLDQLNAAYLQGQQQLQALGYTAVQVNKPTVVKEGAKNNFSRKKLTLGCVGFLLLLGVLFALTLMSLVSNPNALASVGITAATAVNLLSIFAGLIVGVIGLVGLGFLLTNVYRLITVKNQSKIRYILGLLGAFLILGVAGGVAAVVFGQIGKISVEPVVRSKNLIDSSLVGKNNRLAMWGSVPAIAPGEVTFSLNLSIWSAELIKLWEIVPQKLVIDCGNAQQQQISYASTGFSSNCLYDKKGDYVWKALLTYDNKITGEKGITMELAQGKLSFVSEIQLFLTTQNAKSSTPLSATQGEINLGKAPAKITVDATSIFRDFGLKDYQVVRDMDNDNGYDREQMVSFDYIYKMPQVYNPTVKFPALNDFIYSFPVRVEQSDVPICEINLANFSQTKYKIQTNFLDGSVSSIAGYTYHILDTSTNKEIATLKQSTREVDYTFPEKGNYIVSLDFITVDGKRGTCESELLQLAKEDIIVTYVIKQKLPGETVFKEISASAISGGVIALDTIPQAIVIDLVSVSPDSVSMRKNVFFEGKPVLNQGSLYEFTLDQERVYEVVIRLEDSERALFKEIPLSLVVKRPDIVGKLVVEPNAGYEPLKVRFDASQSLVTIPADEIIYFSWDFGDGESKINLPNGVIEHTYKYNHERESGSFQPSVVITTRKGYTTTVQPDLPILVKKQLIQVNLSSTSHPTQSAKLGDSVHFLAEFNGLPETMKRDFGDGSTPVQCKGRGCAEVNKIFELPGTYTVKLSLTFEDTQTVETTLGFNVR